MAISKRKKRSLPIADADDRQLPVADRRLIRLYQYWLQKRGARSMPSRADIDPLDMRFILGHLMLIDVRHPGPEFRIRLQGSELTWWIGQELTGTNLEFPAPLRARSARVAAIPASCRKRHADRLDGQRFARRNQAALPGRHPAPLDRGNICRSFNRRRQMRQRRARDLNQIPGKKRRNRRGIFAQ